MLTIRELGIDGLRKRINDQDAGELGPELARIRSSGRVIPGGPGQSPSIGPVNQSTATQATAGPVTRKIDAAQRLLIANEDHLGLIVSEIYRVYDTEEGKVGVSKFAAITRNILNKTVDRLAVVYNRPPVRKFAADGGTPDMAIAWREAVLDRGRFNDRAEQWARFAFYLNVVHVLPMVVGEGAEAELTYVTVLPHAADVVFEHGEDEPSILVYLSRGDGFCRVAVDAERYLYLDENWTVVREVEHGYLDLRGRPMRPWVPWRVRSHTQGSEDYWQYPRGRQLVTATLNVGVVAAQMRFTRKANNAKLMTITAQVPVVAPQQTLSPEHPVELQEGALAVHDLNTPVTEFIADMDAEEEAIAESYGVTRGTTDRSKSVDPHAEHVQVATLRDGMVKHIHRADVETSIMTAIIMSAHGHEASARLDPAAVGASLRVKFQALTFVATPKDRFDAYAQQLSLGLMSHVDARMAEHPDEDEATATVMVMKTIEQRNRFSNELAKHSLAADATEDGENIAQQTGRIGGEATSDEDENGHDDTTSE